MRLKALFFAVALASACHGGSSTPADSSGEGVADVAADAPITGCGTECGAMVAVPAGPYTMGCDPAVNAVCRADEAPPHQVDVPAFQIDKYEVTVGQYKACVAASKCTQPGGGSSACTWWAGGADDHPVNCVSWDQAVAFCAFGGKRLCSEAEWEKAARGTDGRLYPWGNDPPTCEDAAFNAPDCPVSTTLPVGTKPAGASPFGALDMAGNVWEWVEDWYHASYDAAPADGSVWQTPVGDYRVNRGGAFDNAPTVRATARATDAPADQSYGIGVRCCKSGVPAGAPVP